MRSVSGKPTPIGNIMGVIEAVWILPRLKSTEHSGVPADCAISAYGYDLTAENASDLPLYEAWMSVSMRSLPYHLDLETSKEKHLIQKTLNNGLKLCGRMGEWIFLRDFPTLKKPL